VAQFLLKQDCFLTKAKEKNLKLRVAEASDAEGIVAVINPAFRASEGWLVARDRIDLAGAIELFRKGTFLVADDEGVIAGCVYVEPRGERSYLGLLSVHPKRQKSGLARTLMDAAEDYCAKAGFRFMDLRIINLRTELPPFYRHFGYVESGTEPLTPGIETRVPCHFVVMSKPLA
jgi:N-acetylglutamate synthase-like GNAT family acetyltransferase